jgi:hypothetical protein
VKGEAKVGVLVVPKYPWNDRVENWSTKWVGLIRRDFRPR